MEYIAFMAAIKHEHREYVMETLKEYDIGAYLVSFETAKDSHKETNGEHIHFLVQMTIKDYNAYSKRVFIKKFALRGKAAKDKPRQYGKVQKIESIDRMAAYTLKDGNIESNMSQAQLDAYREISHQRDDERTLQDALFDYMKECLDKHFYNHEYEINHDHVSFRLLALFVYDYFKKEKINAYLSKIKIEKYVRTYQLTRMNMSREGYIDQLFGFYPELR